MGGGFSSRLRRQALSISASLVRRCSYTKMAPSAVFVEGHRFSRLPRAKQRRLSDRIPAMSHTSNFANCYAGVLAATLGFGCLIFAQDRSSLQGWRPYTPTRLEWLAVDLNA